MPIDHPRLLLTSFESLRQTVVVDEFAARYYAKVKADADAIVLIEPRPYAVPDGLRLLDASREVLRRVYSLAITFIVEDDDRYSTRLWAELESAAGYPDWNSQRHFLDTAEMTHAFAIGYDWLFDVWSDSQRRTIRTAIRDFGLLPGLEVHASGTGFPQLDHNWNLVCNGGLVLGALAIEEDEPEIARDIIAKAAESVPKAIALYAPVGAYPEGVGYWAYASKYLVVYVAALASATGSDHGFSQSAGLPETGYFPLYLTGPTGLTFNYYDATDEVHQPSEMFWLAATFDEPVFGWWGTLGADNEPVSWQQSPAGLLWYRPDLVEDPVTAGLALDRAFSSSEAVSLRSEWGNSRAAYIAAKAGDNSTNHGDLDLGTFVLDALGVRWAVDLGPDDYNLPGYWFREPGGARWELYRKRAEGQNTLIVNPGAHADQLETAIGQVERLESSSDAAISVLELSEAHPDISSWKRGIGLFDGRSQFVVQDEVTVTEPGEIYWFLHTRAGITLAPDGRSATLTSDGETLLARIAEPQDAVFTVTDARPLPTSPDPAGQDPNDGVRKLVIRLVDVTRTRISIQLSPVESGTSAPALRAVSSLEQWRP